MTTNKLHQTISFKNDKDLFDFDMFNDMTSKKEKIVKDEKKENEEDQDSSGINLLDM